MQSFKSLVALLFCGLTFTTTFAQNNEELKSWSLGVQVGHIYDLGDYRFDIAPEEDLRGLNGDKTRFDLGGQVYFEKQLSPLWGIQLGGAFGSVTGANTVEYYEGSFYNMSLDGLFMVSNLMVRNVPSSFHYYLKGGTGLGRFESNQFLIFDDSPDNSQSGSFNLYRLGVGMHYQLNSSLRLEMEVLYTSILNDGFDGYDNASGHDALVNSSIGLAYTFGGRDQDPLFNISSFSQRYIGYPKLNDAHNSEEEAKPRSDDQSARIDSLVELNKGLSKRMTDQERLIVEQRELLKEALSREVGSNPSKITMFFNFDSSTLEKEEMQKLYEWLSQFEKPEEYNFKVTAHADKVGSQQYNAGLKQRRAASVLALITDLGIPSEGVTILEGESSSKDPDQSFLLRRTEVVAIPK